MIIFYLKNDYKKIKKKKIYILKKEEFGYFNTMNCWSGKSKGDYTIVNVLSVDGEPSGKIKEVIDFYNKPEYKKLFQQSKDAWSKIQDLI